jgi:Trypsin-like peptidase domain
MNERLLNNISIRVTTSYNGDTLRGSGVLVQNAEKVNYVITAEHCIFGKEDDRAKFKDIDHSDISIEYRDFQSGSIIRIQTKKIAYKSVDEDIAIIELEKAIESEENIKYSIFSEIHNEEPLHFRGFPKWLQSNNEANNYKCVYKGQRDESSFIIKSDDIVDSTGQSTADITARGLSGSGVFLYRNNRLHLLGIVTDIRDENGTFGHLVCKKLDNVFGFLKMEHESIEVRFALSQNGHFSDLEYKSIFLNYSINNSIDSCEIQLVFQNLGNVNITSFSFFVSLFKLERQEFKIGKMAFELLQDRKHLKPQQDNKYSFILPNTFKFKSYKDLDNHFVVIYGKYFDDLSNEPKSMKEFIKLRFDESNNTLKSEFIVGSQLLELETIHKQEKKIHIDKIDKIDK